MAYLLQGSLIILACVFLLAATSKTFYPKQFANALRISGVPTFLVRPIAIATVISEMALTTSLLAGMPLSTQSALSGALILLSLFTGWLIWVRMRKISLQCGCFGQSKSDVNVGNIIRNSLFIALAILALFLTQQETSPIVIANMWFFSIGFAITACYVGIMVGRLYELIVFRKVVATSRAR